MTPSHIFIPPLNQLQYNYWKDQFLAILQVRPNRETDLLAHRIEWFPPRKSSCERFAVKQSNHGTPLELFRLLHDRDYPIT